MHNQVGMGMRYRSQHLKKYAQPCSHAKPALIAIAIDVVTLDVFENEVRLPGLRDSCVEQLGDVWIRQPAEYIALTFEAMLIATRRSNLPSLRSASQTLPIPPWPICDIRV